MQRGKLVALVAMFSLSACGGESTPNEPAAADSSGPESSANQAESPTPSQSPTPSPGEPTSRTLTFASPCEMAEKAFGGEIFGLLGGKRRDTTFYEPGDNLAGPIPTKNYGCLFSSADAQFGFSIGGTPLTEKGFEQQIPTDPACNSIAVPADLGATVTVATSCPAGRSTSLTIGALYGDRSFTCGTDSPSKRVNSASTDHAVDLCIQIAEQVTQG